MATRDRLLDVLIGGFLLIALLGALSCKRKKRMGHWEPTAKTADTSMKEAEAVIPGSDFAVSTPISLRDSDTSAETDGTKPSPS